MNGTASDKATKANLGDWHWDRTERVLSVTNVTTDLYAMLSGVWSLSAFAHLFDGLSAKRLSDALNKPADAVLLDLTLADGRTVQFTGGQTHEGELRGFILAIAPLDSNDEPGPALIPVYQPIYDLKSGHIAGFEALARWPGQEDAADRFDDKALATNMLIHACDALSKWRTSLRGQSVFVQVNLTSRDLADDHLLHLVEALISSHELPHRALRLELTEQAALRDVQRAVDVAKGLQDVGAGLVLDDFGSGHSSFMWLAELPADGLKVDAELISNLDDPRMRIILEAITLLAKRLGMKTTAEGVENISQLAVLRELNFDAAQGFALGRPMSFDAAFDLLGGA